MSVQLVIVALLAATAAAATEKTVKYSDCQDKTCADTCTSTTYPVGKCKEVGTSSKTYWRADDCTADTKTFVVKGYKDMGKCESGKAEKAVEVSKTCKPITYTKLSCEGNEGEDKTIKLSFCTNDGCTACDSSSERVFTKGNTCNKKWKLPDEFNFGAACTALPESVTFKVHSDDSCTAASPKEVTVNKACTGYTYQKAACTDDDGVTVTDCKKDDCTGESCTTVKYPLKQYTKDGDSYYYIDKCPVEAAKEISLEEYGDLKKANKTCSGIEGQSAYNVAECVLPAGSSGGSTNSSNSSGGGSSSNSSGAATTKGSTDSGDGSNNGGNGETAAPTTKSESNTTGNASNANNTDELSGAAQLVAPIGAFALFVLAYAL